MKRITKLDYQKIITEATQTADNRYSRTGACRMWKKCEAAAELELIEKTAENRKQVDDKKLIGKEVTIIRRITDNLGTARYGDYYKKAEVTTAVIDSYTPLGVRLRRPYGTEIIYNVICIVD